ncbi:HTH-type transcriptional repressor ComR [Anaerolineales bacterium]|jgi:AcrR family transcriptional regulator|nr:HTH-type transcriptional repressor ComR [Anaerolineales bacterium]
MNKHNNATKKKRVRRDRTEEILETATRLFSEHGYQGTTFSLLAEAAQLTEPGVLHYFPSKTHLLQGVLEYHEQKNAERYLSMLQAEKKSIPDLFSLLENLVAENEKIPGLIQLFTVLVSESIRSDHPAHDYFIDRYRRAREAYVNQFFGEIRENIRPEVDLNELTILILAVMDGLQIQWLLDPKKVDMVAVYRLFSKIIVEYLEN